MKLSLFPHVPEGLVAIESTGIRTMVVGHTPLNLMCYRNLLVGRIPHPKSRKLNSLVLYRYLIINFDNPSNLTFNHWSINVRPPVPYL